MIRPGVSGLESIDRAVGFLLDLMAEPLPLRATVDSDLLCSLANDARLFTVAPSANVILQDGDTLTIDTVIPLTVGRR